jgi:hypothetical protein
MVSAVGPDNDESWLTPSQSRDRQWLWLRPNYHHSLASDRVGKPADTLKAASLSIPGFDIAIDPIDPIDRSSPSQSSLFNRESKLTML